MDCLRNLWTDRIQPEPQSVALWDRLMLWGQAVLCQHAPSALQF